MSLTKPIQYIKYSFGIFILVLLGFLTLNHTNYLDYERPITFDQYNKISFDNFRGLEFFKSNLYGNERFAYVVTSIESEIGDDFVSIQSLFYPSRSFVYKTNINNKELLTHEKYHIKITELFARIAKQRIAQLNEFEKELIEKIIDNVEKEERNFQKEYDYDTFHSYVLSEQKKYENNIDSLLNTLTEYKEPKIKFDEKN